MRWGIQEYSSLTTAVATVAVAGATVFNIFIWQTTKEALDEYRKSSQGTLISTLNKDFFFTDRLYKVRKAIESGKPLLAPQGPIATQDLEDYMGTLDMIYKFKKEGILREDLIEYNFGCSAKEAYKNKEIRNYSPKGYENFQEWGKSEIQEGPNECD